MKFGYIFRMEIFSYKQFTLLSSKFMKMYLDLGT